MKTWTRDEINRLLENNPHAVERAILRIYERQTSTEQARGDTLLHNGVGFSSCHAKRGTYYAKWILSGRHLTGEHLEKARRIAIHHSRQLVEIANG